MFLGVLGLGPGSTGYDGILLDMITLISEYDYLTNAETIVASMKGNQRPEI
jgi:hypothetical protein